MQKIVKYHNDLNKIKFPNFNELEQNLFVKILYELKDKQDNRVFFFPQELEYWSNSHLTNNEILEIITRLKNVFFNASFIVTFQDEQHKNRIHRGTIHLFDEFYEIYEKNEDSKNIEEIVGISMQINSKFAYLLNDLTKDFTSFELAEFIALSGKYTKTLYRLLKQYRQTGYMRMEWGKFKEIMNIPEDYRQIDIDTRVLKPAIKELTAERNLFDTKRIPFKDLSYTKIKGKGRGRGGNVIAIEFIFKKQTDFLTKDEQIKLLQAENAELVTESFKNSMAQAENQELKERIEKLEKISYGIGLNAYCGLKYYSDKGEVLRVLDFMDIPNSSDQNKYKAEILNEKTKETFFVYVESPKHLLNIIYKNEMDLILNNQEIINRRIKK